MQNNLLFRRQFILGPQFIESLEGWNRFFIHEDFFLTAHPDLKVTAIEAQNCHLTIIGEILDPFNPTFDNIQIGKNVATNANKITDVFEMTTPLSGRFVMIVSMGKDHIIFNDPAGFRQIFYYTDPEKRIWCSSQPGLIAENNDLLVDEKIKKEFFNLPLFNKTSEYWYPGNSTVYKDIYHLMPNHYLDLNNGKRIRFWPKRVIEETSMFNSIEEISALLQGIMTSASNRFKIAFAITGGLDSRLLLAASRQVKDKLYYFTHTTNDIKEDHPDISIPVRMLSDLGINHTLVSFRESMENNFSDFLKRNVTTAREAKGQFAFTIFDHFRSLDSEFVVMNGVCSEIARNFYQIPDFVRLNSKILAARVDMIDSPTAIEQFETWLHEIKKIDKYGYRLLDLFYWEHRNANFCSMTYSEYDIAFESFSPLDCRLWLEKMLSANKKYRTWPDYTLFSKIIEHLWPELLKYPINPPKDKTEAFNNFARRLGISYDILRYFKLLYKAYLKK